eukprot:TRINITY_DN4843_c0_g1_i1.p1 TRINITY_DN4843_c0_g1~~TRINITY_DN4843_c0_g1_i1.p1  ORF type:complete len:439 (+),score=148.37 TRINITY_DN4843_c0_g1_i1:57-1373(+)
MIRFLDCSIQKYAWGKLGNSSLVAQLKDSSTKSGLNSKFDIENEIPYAEYWIGTHKNGPTMVKPQKSEENTVSLSNFLDKDLKYLMKVLSVEKALSIQSHPDKALAEELHKKFPAIYKDDNHKPEVCVAVSNFFGMFGFRTKSEIVHFFETRPALESMVSKESVELLKSHMECKDVKCQCLKNVFEEYVHSKMGLIAVNDHVAFLNDLKKEYGEDALTEADNLSLQLAIDYPSDLGVFSPYFFNVMTLKPGEAIYISPNTPHSYLKGDCVEIMACSDNVVRAGLTPKFIDKETLCNMLEYHCEKRVSMNVESDGEWDEYRTPCDEFCLKRLVMEPSTVDGTSKTVMLEANPHERILMVISGSVEMVSTSPAFSESKVNDVNFGNVVLIPANVSVSLTNKSPLNECIIFSAEDGRSIIHESASSSSSSSSEEEEDISEN